MRVETAHSQFFRAAPQLQVQLANAIKESMPVASQNNISVSDEIDKLFVLMQKGAITQEEYIVQKNKLLGN